jgi:3-hydroxybutyryl-CoA dehydrogenase
LTVQSTKDLDGGKLAHQLGIVGSGSIACGLARTAAEHHEVVLWARSDASAERAGAKLDGSGRIVTDLDELQACDLIVEAVAEDVAIKTEIHERLGRLAPEGTLLSTTTSSLSVAEIARASGRPDRFAALHVFNPVEKMKLVELCFPEEATEDTRATFRDLCERLDKVAVEVPDAAGFVVNKLLFPYLFDAVRMLERGGIEPKAIDTCMKLGAGHPMGPLALLDFVGLDVSAAIGESIGADVPKRVYDLIDEGKLGKKTGAGFYDYGER